MFLGVEDNMSNKEERYSRVLLNTTRKNAIPTIRYPLLSFDYHIPVTQLKGPKRNGDMPGTKGKWRYARPKGNGDMQESLMESSSEIKRCPMFLNTGTL